jgi:hypothetical protein
MPIQVSITQKPDPPRSSEQVTTAPSDGSAAAKELKHNDNDGDHQQQVDQPAGCRAPSSTLPAPTRVSVPATTEDEQDQKNDQYGVHGPPHAQKG